MKKNRWILLLIFPLLAFLADQAMGHPGPGDKRKKKKKKAATEAQASDTVSLGQLEGFSRDFEDHSINLLNAYFRKLDTTEFEYDRWRFARTKGMSEEKKKFLDTHLIHEVKEIDPDNIYNGRFWPSRCWKGYQYGILANSIQLPVQKGVLLSSNHCSRHELGEFRYDMKKSLVEMRLPHRMGYVSIAEYFRIRTAVLGSS